MRGRVSALIDRENVPTSRTLLVLLAAAASAYMIERAHADGLTIARLQGFGTDFGGTILDADRAIRHGLSPYPDPAKPLPALPAVYLPPIFLATLPLTWLPLDPAVWIWFGCLLSAALGILWVLGVRDPWCYLLFAASLPIEQALVLGNASILVGLGVALAWRFRDRRLLCPIAVAATMTIKFWVWPLLVWLLIVRPRVARRAAIAFAALTLGSWAIIRFRGFVDYPALIRAEGSHFASAGVLFVPALVQLHLAVTVATALGLVASVAVLWVGWTRRANELELFSLALLAALVATTVGWPHYLVLAAIPIAIQYPTLAPAWAWFPALWIATHLGPKPGQFGYSLTFCIFAALPTVLVTTSRRNAPGGPALEGEHGERLPAGVAGAAEDAIRCASNVPQGRILSVFGGR